MQPGPSSSSSSQSSSINKVIQTVKIIAVLCKHVWQTEPEHFSILRSANFPARCLSFALDGFFSAQFILIDRNIFRHNIDVRIVENKKNFPSIVHSLSVRGMEECKLPLKCNKYTSKHTQPELRVSTAIIIWNRMDFMCMGLKIDDFFFLQPIFLSVVFGHLKEKTQ